MATPSSTSTSTRAPRYKLTYFNLGARGEPIRLLFAMANVPFEDHRIEFSDWLEAKQTMPWRQMPVLRDGDLTICQSKVILKYLARKFNCAGLNDMEEVKCEEYVEAMSDFMDICISYNTEKEPVRKAEKAEQMFDQAFPLYLGRFDAILKENGEFLVGKKITFADLYVAHFLQTTASRMPSLLDDYPELRRHQDTVFNYSGIKEWVARRPPSRW